MATRMAMLPNETGSDAQFRAWIGEVHAGIINAGWVRRTGGEDSGQIDYATVARPGTSTYAGYALYAMQDALQASYPYFVRFDYGTGGTATYSALKVQIGTGTDGAGGLTGNVSTSTALVNAGSSATIMPCFSSGTTSRFQMAFWVTGTTSQVVVSIERDLDSSGVNQNVGAGVCLVRANAAPFQQFVPNAGLGAVPASEGKFLGCLGQSIVGQAARSTVTVGPIRHAYGPLRNPGIGLCVCPTQFISNANVTLSMYGTSHNYIALTGITYSTSLAAASVACSLLILYE